MDLIRIIESVLSKFGLGLLVVAGEPDPDYGYPMVTLRSRIMTKGALRRVADRARTESAQRARQDRAAERALARAIAREGQEIGRCV